MKEEEDYRKMYFECRDKLTSTRQAIVVVLLLVCLFAWWRSNGSNSSYSAPSNCVADEFRGGVDCF
jgi:hypothetical protein